VKFVPHDQDTSCTEAFGPAIQTAGIWVVWFRLGDFLALPAADGEFGALIAFYSLIHLEPGELTPALREIGRVLAPGALVLASFHVGSDVVHRDEFLGHPVDVNFRFLEFGDLAAAMESAGLAVEMRLERVRYPDEGPTTRGYLLARNPANEQQGS
jgi:SAM-dependent methyltransferase